MTELPIYYWHIIFQNKKTQTVYFTTQSALIIYGMKMSTAFGITEISTL